jgi:ribA/ribD-fused uncharacterized protein
MTETFTFFWNGPFSQWYPSPFKIGDFYFNCAEQYMMAEKAKLFADDDAWRAIMKARDPKTQKALGRKVKRFNETLWNLHARTIVTIGSTAKYTQNQDLLKLLLDTAPTTLVEASPYDRIWGIGLDEHDTRAYSRETWLGTNWLGEILTNVRNTLLTSP